MAASAWLIHDKIKLYVGQKLVDFDTDDFRCNLYLSTSNIATLSINALSTATNQVATAGGYTQDAKVADNPTWTESAGVVTFSCDDIVWTASGSGITAQFAAIWDNTVASPVADPIVCHTLLDTTPADVFAASGNAFTIEIHADGVFEST